MNTQYMSTESKPGRKSKKTQLSTNPGCTRKCKRTL